MVSNLYKYYVISFNLKWGDSNTKKEKETMIE